MEIFGPRTLKLSERTKDGSMYSSATGVMKIGNTGRPGEGYQNRLIKRLGIIKAR